MTDGSTNGIQMMKCNDPKCSICKPEYDNRKWYNVVISDSSFGNKLFDDTYLADSADQAKEYAEEAYEEDVMSAYEPGSYKAEAVMSWPRTVEVTEVVKEDSVVKNPNHYQNNLGVEVIDIINEYFSNNYNLGNVIKYLLRADRKGNRQQDLEKALVYLTWEVERGR